MPSSLIIADAHGQEIGSSYAGGTNGQIGMPIYTYQDGRGQPPTNPSDPGVPTPERVDTMLRLDGKAAQIEQALTLPIRSADWQIVGDDDAARWCREWLANLDPPLDDVIGQIAGASLFGRALFEIVWDTDPRGRVTPTRIAWRPPHNTTVDRDKKTDAPAGLLQRLPGVAEPVPIPLVRSVIYLHNRHRAPRDGVSDVLPVYKAHRAKQAIIWLRDVYLNRAALPWVIGNAGIQDRDAIRSIAQRLASIRSGGALGLGPDESASALDAGGQASAAFDLALTWCNREMTGSVMAQFLDLGQSHVGSFALSKDHSDFFTMGRDAVLKAIASDLTAQLVVRACRANGLPGPCPTFRFDPLSETDAAQLTSMFEKVMTAPAVNPAVPAEFITELVVKTAGLLGLDVAKVTAGLGGQSSPGGQMAAAATAATALLAATSPGGQTPAAG